MTIIDSGAVNEIYNVAGGYEQKNIDTVKKIIEAYYGPNEDYKSHIDLSYARQGQDIRYALNDEKLRKLGWKPKKTFDIEIGDIVKYYKNKFVW